VKQASFKLESKSETEMGDFLLATLYFGGVTCGLGIGGELREISENGLAY